MPVDLSVDLIQATVQVEQPLGDGTRTVGTGFLIDAPKADGTPRVVLITAGHVFDKMPNVEARVGYRIEGATGRWSYAPQPLQIRTAEKSPLWIKHPTRDVAAIVVEAPEQFAKAAIPLSWLANDDTFKAASLGPGDEMMALGYPRGLAANQAGFPILRSGRVASWPIAPSNQFPTFLLDFSVFPGNSGGPVYLSRASSRRPGAANEAPTQFIAGILTQQVELNKERLEIGIVTHARFIRETIALLDNPQMADSLRTAAAEPEVKGAVAASDYATSSEYVK